jgi:hypothetical protein
MVGHTCGADAEHGCLIETQIARRPQLNQSNTTEHCNTFCQVMC